MWSCQPQRRPGRLLAYLIATGKVAPPGPPLELLWDVADDPKGGLRWCLTKIRPLVDEPSWTGLLPTAKPWSSAKKTPM